MTWTAYSVAFRLHSPMHVGWRKLGNLQQTRPYLVGRTLWGALTARLTREHRRTDYRQVGEEIDELLTFTYFYPSIQDDPEKVILWPWAEQWDEFAWTFLNSYASTALDNGRNAEAGSLHETEYIAPYIRKPVLNVEPVPVYLVGYIFQNMNSKVKLSWQAALNKLQLGGERGYGWGRVSLVRNSQPIPAANNTITCFGYSLDYTTDYPVITVPAGKTVLAHVDTKDVEDLTGIKGSIEPLIGRETRASGGFGKDFSPPEICWMPGSKVTEEKQFSFRIQQKGMWKPL